VHGDDHFAFAMIFVCKSSASFLSQCPSLIYTFCQINADAHSFGSFVVVIVAGADSGVGGGASSFFVDVVVISDNRQITIPP
jgi:hypothetical protein